MIDPNGDTDLPMTGDPRVDAALIRLHELEQHYGLFESIKDALIVNAHLEKRQSEMLLRHTELIAFHDLKMREFDEKMNALIDREMRREGGPEART